MKKKTVKEIHIQIRDLQVQLQNHGEKITRLTNANQ